MFIKHFTKLNFTPKVLDIKFGNIGAPAICFQAKLLIYLACRSCATAETVKIAVVGQRETIAECAYLVVVFSLHEGWAQLKECHCRRDWLKSSHNVLLVMGENNFVTYSPTSAEFQNFGNLVSDAFERHSHHYKGILVIPTSEQQDTWDQLYGCLKPKVVPNKQ
ncbi:hypothetical protein DAPPUDRAFT_255308 [Daphnia pulex]|uniref:Uncharacterized protein n=1 Tax=Daphnia pulex TaxID=6669 RepID=E9H8Y0_DAPPU|nr:hypothetical protein DAPPUDRAFT_255308 [Daphnia pulex]|eukprot:EFX71818.1 hypothetical protein DAPPUDRAFT_255308 [Daphnia pulex]